MEQKNLRLVTYNIHKAIGGLDRKYRPERVIEVLQHCDADVILLQEVDEGVPRSRRERQVDVIGDALGFKYRSFFPNVRLRDGHYGNALLSRFRIDHDENIDLTIPLKKRRSALHARMNVPTNGEGEHARLWLFNVHLGLAGFERKLQLRRLLGWQHQHRMSHKIVSVIAGDFNDVWGRLGKSILEPEEYRGSASRILTFPAARPLRPLDRVFVHGPAKITHSYRSRQKLATQASDHLPLVAEIDL